IQFAAGAPSTASVTISDQGNGGGENISIAVETGNGPAGPGTSGLFLAGHPTNVQANNLSISTSSANQGNQLVSGAVTFDTGTFTLGGSVTIGAITGGNTTTVGVNGSITIGGSTPNNTATGVFTSGAITLGNFSATDPVVDAQATATATFTINGGTA